MFLVNDVLLLLVANDDKLHMQIKINLTNFARRADVRRDMCVCVISTDFTESNEIVHNYSRSRYRLVRLFLLLFFFHLEKLTGALHWFISCCP